MTLITSPVLAEAATTTFEPLFGNQWLALLVILIGVAVFMLAVAALGRWLAANHPDEPLPPTQPTPIVDSAPSAEIFAAIAAAVAVTFGGKARIASVQPAIPLDSDGVDPSRLQWSMEGRRQIYSSHKVR